MIIRSRATPSTLLAVSLLALACGVGDEASDSQDFARVDVPEYTIDQFMETTSIFGSSFSPDGTKILVSTDETGILNVYSVPVSGGDPTQLTSSTVESIRASSYFPEDERFIYMADEGGNELDHVYVRELDGSVTDLTPGEGLKASFAGWAKDDQSFYLASNERDQRFFDLFEVSIDGYEKTLMYRDDTGYQFSGVSPDERYIAFVKPTTTNDSDIYLYDREAGEMRHLTPHEGEVSNSVADFSPDGGSLYVTTDEGSEFAYLVRMSLETGEREVIMQPDWDVWFAFFSETGRYLTIGINEDARTRIRMFEMPGMSEIELPAAPGLDITSVNVSDDESTMAFYASSSRSPRNL